MPRTTARGCGQGAGVAAGQNQSPVAELAVQANGPGVGEVQCAGARRVNRADGNRQIEEAVCVLLSAGVFKSAASQNEVA